MKPIIPALMALFLLLAFVPPALSQEVVVMSSLEEIISWLESENWWGIEKREQQLEVPRTIIVAISQRWRKHAPQLQVETKKEIFYRFMLPLVVHANTMVLDRRQRLQNLDDAIAKGKTLSGDDDAWLRGMAVVLRIGDQPAIDRLSTADDLRKIIKEALYRLDVIPAGLVLGQAAYESGYGTSRFAVEGNSLFGQWTFGGKGLKPEQQRKHLGDHRIASFDFPFDSVRGYFINLSSHPAYEEFRRLRAELKAAGKPVGSMALADGLKNYSERGQAYVDTLKGIIRVNKFDAADRAVFKDEPMRFYLGAADQAAVAKLKKDIEAMRASGEFEEIVARMRLE